MMIIKIQDTIDRIILSCENSLFRDVEFKSHERFAISIVALLSQSLEKSISDYFTSKKSDKKNNLVQNNLICLEGLIKYISEKQTIYENIILKARSQQNIIKEKLDYRTRKLRFNKSRLKKYYYNKNNNKEYRQSLIRNIKILKNKIYYYNEKADKSYKKYHLLNYRSKVLNVYISFATNLQQLLRDYENNLTILEDHSMKIEEINELNPDFLKRLIKLKKFYQNFKDIINESKDYDKKMVAIRWFEKTLTH